MINNSNYKTIFRVKHKKSVSTCFLHIRILKGNDLYL